MTDAPYDFDEGLVAVIDSVAVRELRSHADTLDAIRVGNYAVQFFRDQPWPQGRTFALLAGSAEQYWQRESLVRAWLRLGLVTPVWDPPSVGRVLEMPVERQAWVFEQQDFADDARDEWSLRFGHLDLTGLGRAIVENEELIFSIEWTIENHDCQTADDRWQERTAVRDERDLANPARFAALQKWVADEYRKGRLVIEHVGPIVDAPDVVKRAEERENPSFDSSFEMKILADTTWGYLRHRDGAKPPSN